VGGSLVGQAGFGVGAFVAHTLLSGCQLGGEGGDIGAQGAAGGGFGFGACARLLEVAVESGVLAGEGVGLGLGCGGRGGGLGAAGALGVQVAGEAVSGDLGVPCLLRRVHGAIGSHFTALGEERGPLGYPTSDESTARDGVGRFNSFQRGVTYWSPTTGAQEVHGAIRDKWAALGSETGLLGYPTTDEGGSRDGVGRYNGFQGGMTFWSPATGANAVQGAILGRWLSMGAEAGSLGYPVTDEYAVPGGRRSDFQRGSLVWDAATGNVTVQ